MEKQLRYFVSAVLLFATACGGSAQMQVSTSAETETEAVAEAPAEEPEPAPAVEDPSDVHVEDGRITIDQKIHFGNDSDEIMGDSNELLDHIAQALKNHTELTTLHVIGHTDATGSAKHNMDLSGRRAAAVVAALQARGVTQKMDSKGVGKDEPVCQEDTPECHEKNRRVEFLVEKAQ